VSRVLPNRSIYVALALFVVLVLASACSVWPDQGKGSSSGEPDEPHLADSITAQDVQGWQQATGLFNTGGNDPIVVERTDTHVLYVHDDRLLYAEFGDAPTTLSDWNGPLVARAWANGPMWLIGLQTPEPEPEPKAWLGVQFDQLSDGVPTVEKLDAFFKPSDVLEVKTVESPRLVFVTVKNASTYSEFAYGLPGEGFFIVNIQTPPGVAHNEIHRRRPEPSAEAERFERGTTFPITGGTVYTFEDERGTVIYCEQPYFYLWRYFDHSPLAFKAYQDINGDWYALGRFETYGGTRILSLLNWGFRSYLEDEPRLLSNEDWRLLERSSFYRIEDESVETIKFSYDPEVARATHREFLTAGASFVNQEGSLLAYNLVGENQYLSLYDLINYQLPDSHMDGSLAPADDLWLYRVEPQHAEAETRPMPYEVGRTRVSLPPLGAPTFTGDPPFEMVNAVPDSYSDDTAVGNPRLRNIDGTWYALMGLELNAYREGKFEVVGKLPVTVARTVGEGVSIYGPMDFALLGSSWYVADTFGNVVVKLNEKFELLDKYPLPVPSSLQLSDGNLVVTSLKGQTILTPGFAVVSESKPEAVPATDPEENRAVRDGQYYEDQEYGLTWLFDESGYLYQYRRASKDYRWFYIGREENANATGRVVLYRDQVLVFLDNRSFIFTRDGEWQKTIEYPRTKPDGIYVTSPPGENTYHLDEEGGKLYLVQGFRVLEVDLESGDTRTLFMQADSRMGKLLARNGRLYVSAQVENAGYGMREPSYTEIIVYDLATGDVTRFITDGVYQTDCISDSGQLVLWQRDSEEGSVEGVATYFDLAALKVPAVSRQFPVGDLADKDPILFTDMVGKEHELPRAKKDEFLSLLGEAVFESTSFPERDTGGRIVGQLTFGTSSENPASIEVHGDFLWFDHQAFYLDNAMVERLTGLFK